MKKEKVTKNPKVKKDKNAKRKLKKIFDELVSKVKSVPPKELKKRLILIAGGIGAIVILGVIANIAVLPGINYSLALKKMETQDYKAAVKLLEKLDDYKNSNDKLDGAYFEYGKVLIKDGDFSDAITILEKTKNDEAGKYIEYAEALNNLEGKNYVDAIKPLEKLSGFENADEKLKEAYYLRAGELLDEEKFDNAKEYYSKALDYEDAKEKIEICRFLTAEKKYLEGYLYEAKTLYEELPKDLVYKNVKVSDRLETLSRYDAFVKLSGTWKGTNGYYEVRHIYKRDGSWESWYNSYSAEAPIKCVINGDGSVKITGRATFYSFTNYSTVNSAVKNEDVDVPIDITVKAGETIPKKLVTNYPGLIANSGVIGYANVEYTGKEIKLNFSLNDSDYSQYFSNKYTSRITFNSKK